MKITITIVTMEFTLNNSHRESIQDMPIYYLKLKLSRLIHRHSGTGLLHNQFTHDVKLSNVNIHILLPLRYGKQSKCWRRSVYAVITFRSVTQKTKASYNIRIFEKITPHTNVDSIHDCTQFSSDKVCDQNEITNLRKMQA